MKLKINDDIVLNGLLSVHQSYDRQTGYAPKTEAIFSDTELNTNTLKLGDDGIKQIAVLDNTGAEITTFDVSRIDGAEKYADDESRVIIRFS